jgi:hypothetical protein
MPVLTLSNDVNIEAFVNDVIFDNIPGTNDTNEGKYSLRTYMNTHTLISTYSYTKIHNIIINIKYKY